MSSDNISITFFPPAQQQTQDNVATPKYYPSNSATLPTEYPNLKIFYLEYLTKGKHVEAKGNVYSFSLTKFPDNRRQDASAKWSYGIVLDFDSMPEIRLPVGIQYAYFTTPSDTPERRRYRLIVPFVKPLSVGGSNERENFKNVVLAFLKSQPHLPEIGALFLDHECIDKRSLLVSQGWFLPHHVNGGLQAFEHGFSEGAPFDATLVEPPVKWEDRDKEATVSFQVVEPVTPLPGESKQRLIKAKKALKLLTDANMNEDGIAGSLQGKSGNTKLFRACCIGCDFGVPPVLWSSTLAQLYLPFCSPLFSQVEFNTVLRSAYTNSQTAKAGKTGYKFEEFSAEIEAEITAAQERISIQEVYQEEPTEPEDIISPLSKLLSENRLPEEAYNLPGGLAAQLFHYFLYECPEISTPLQGPALCATLAVLSVVKGKRFFLSHDALHTAGNLFLLCMEQTGVGKSQYTTAAANLITQVLAFREGHSPVIGKAASMMGLFRAISRRPLHTALIVGDEFAQTINITEGKTASGYQKEYISELNEMYYGWKHIQYHGREYADDKQTAKPLAHPHLTLLGNVQPALLHGILHLASSGACSRYLAIHSDIPNSNILRTPLTRPPTELIFALQNIATYNTEEGFDQGSDMGDLGSRSLRELQFTKPVALSPDASALLDSLTISMKSKYAKLLPNSGEFTQRSRENTIKIALALTDVTLNDGTIPSSLPVISSEQVFHASIIVSQSITLFVAMNSYNQKMRHHAVYGIEAVAQRIIKCLENHGNQSERDIVKSLRTTPRKDVTKAIELLLDSNALKIKSKNRSGFLVFEIN